MTDSFAIRISAFRLPHIRQSNFVIRHCPAPHDATGRFDFVLANPPFNVNAVDKERLKDMVGPGRRFPINLPRTDNGNCLWIQLLYSALKNRDAATSGGRAGFVMANSASDARSSEQEHRRQFIENRSVDVMVAALAESTVLQLNRTGQNQ